MNYGVVAWMNETLDADRLKYNEDHPGEGQDSLSSNPPEEEATFEAPGFRAANRMFDWLDKYSVPARGGGKSGKKKGSASKKKRRTDRQYLETDNDQEFNQT